MANVQINSNTTLQVQQTGSGFLSDVTPVKTQSLKTIMQASGVLADQVDTLYLATLAFSATTPQTLDLTALVDMFGAAVSFARVNILAFKVLSTTNGQALTIGNAGTNEWSGAAALLGASGTIRVLASTSANDGYAIFAAPNTTGYVVDSTHKALKLDPGSGAFSVQVIVAGRSA